MQRNQIQGRQNWDCTPRYGIWDSVAPSWGLCSHLWSSPEGKLCSKNRAAPLKRPVLALGISPVTPQEVFRCMNISFLPRFLLSAPTPWLGITFPFKPHQELAVGIPRKQLETRTPLTKASTLRCRARGTLGCLLSVHAEWHRPGRGRKGVS